MKITAAASSSGWFGLGAVGTDFDGVPPVPSLRLLWPANPDGADRLAVASALVFSAWTAGAMTLPHQLSALTAQRISEWYAAQGGWVHPMVVRWGGLPIPRGTRRVRLDWQPVGDSKSGPNESLRFVAPTRGTAVRAGSSEIASNVAFLEQRGALPQHRLFAHLGAAVLVAEQADIGIIEIPGLAQFPSGLRDATVRLAECVSLGPTDAR